MIDIRKRKYKIVQDFMASVREDYYYLFDFKQFGILDSINEDNFMKYENVLNDINRIIWESELASGEYVIISWNKYGNENRHRGKVTHATFSRYNDIISFCDLSDGDICEIEYDAILALCQTDAAIVKNNTETDYTVAHIGEDYYDSYNLASKFLTPKQMLKIEQKYKTNYNEVLLDTSKIKKFTSISLTGEKVIHR